MRSTTEIEELANDTEGHGIDEVCVMTPHTSDSLTDAMYHDAGDEETERGFHRKLAHIRCTCGAKFNGHSYARQDFTEHLEENR